MRDHIYTIGVLIFGVVATYFLYSSSNRYEKESAETKFAVNAEVVATSLDLLISNQTIRIQNYENDLQSLLANVDENNFYTAAMLRNSLFDKIIRINALLPPNSYTEPKLIRSIKLEAAKDADRDVTLALNKNFENIFFKMLQEKRKYVTFFFSMEGTSYFALVWTLPFKQNSFLLFLGEAEKIFASGQVMPDGMSLILEQELDHTHWFVEKRKNGLITVNKIPNEESVRLKSSQAILHHYKPKFSEISYKLTFFSDSIPGVMDGSSRVILYAGLMITFLLALLISSLVRRNIEVQKLVKEKTAHLRVESEKAKEAAYAKTRFLANVSHEIRTPLNIIMGMTDLFRETTLTKKQKEFIENMNTASNHLIRLIDDILDMARIDSQDVKFKFENVDFLKFIEEIVHLVRPVCAEKGLKFYFNMDAQFACQIYTDPSRLKQVLINLINNAVKFTDQGEVELEVRYLKKGPITTQTARVEFLIRDTGVGIAQTKQEDIFKAFYQVNPSTTRNKSGVGLGLAISQAIVSRLNGNISLKSEYGKGTEFSVKIPLMVENSSPWIQRFSRETIKGKNLLIIHDNQQSYVKPVVMFSRYAQLNLRSISWTEICSTSFKSFLADFDYVLMIPGESYQKEDLTSFMAMVKSHQKILIARTSDYLSLQSLAKHEQVSTLTAPILPTEFFQGLGIKMKTEAVPVKEKDLKLSSEKSLVIVDDDPSNLLLLKAYLSGQSFKVRYANHGRNALEMCQKEKPDVLIADLQMPEMDGFTLVKELRKQNVEPVKVVILTADAQEETIQEATQLGIEAYLTKPIRKAEFLKALVEVLN